MVHREDEAAARSVQLAVHAGDARTRQVALQRVTSQRHDHGGVEGRLLSIEVAGTGRDLLRFRVAVAGWAAFDDVGDEDVLARPTKRAEQLVQQLAGGAYERPPGGVFAST